MKVKTKMKKLMLIVATVALAVGAQAALAVTWQTGTGVKDVSGNAFTTSVSGYTAEIMFSTASDMSSPMAGVTGTSATAYKTKGSAGFGGPTSEAFDPGTYYAQVTITEDATGKKWTSEIGSFTVADGQTAGPTVNFTSGLNMGGSSLIGSTAYSGGSSGDIPEPTSGLLLALGGAMLALRRRRA